jgi:hypothetical protein
MRDDTKMVLNFWRKGPLARVYCQIRPPHHCQIRPPHHWIGRKRGQARAAFGYGGRFVMTTCMLDWSHKTELTQEKRPYVHVYKKSTKTKEKKSQHAYTFAYVLHVMSYSYSWARARGGMHYVSMPPVTMAAGPTSSTVPPHPLEEVVLFVKNSMIFVSVVLEGYIYCG